MTVTVFNLATYDELTFTCPPRDAVLAAYAQSLGDWNTWEYERNYGHLVRYSGRRGRTVSCGDFAAVNRQAKCDCDCRGWAHFNLGETNEGVERCDECAIFSSDTEAAKAHDRHCSCGAYAGYPCARCHACLGSLVGRERHCVDDRVYCENCNPKTEDRKP